MQGSSILHAAFLVTFFAPMVGALLLALGHLTRVLRQETAISNVARIVFMIYLFATLVLIGGFIAGGAMPIGYDVGTLSRHHLTLALSLYLDTTAAVFLTITAITANIIVFYSHRYLHRDPGFFRFFMILLFFTFGMTMIFCAGSFNFLFAGWEIVGLSSFLLIAFYWHRPAAAENANRAYFIYRATDFGLLASAFISHMIWHKEDLFFELSSGNLIESFNHFALWQQWCLSLLIFLPVLGKSAQFPFSYWLPKAMEGPTPSSAIFYGSLSVHAGVFLLLRTYSIWQHTPGFSWLVGGIGLITALSTTLIGRIQANVKGQIGYASIAQVGIMLVELALGLPGVALLHFVGNASLRCFQLLISPSIVAEQLHIHHALEGHRYSHPMAIENIFSRKLQSTLYLFAMNDGYFEHIINRWIVRPIFTLATQLNMLYQRLFDTLLMKKPKGALTPAPSTANMFVWPLGMASAFYPLTELTKQLPHSPWYLAVQYGLLALLLTLSIAALGERKLAKRALNWVTLSNLLAAAAVICKKSSYIEDASIYVFGLFFSWILATRALTHVGKRRTVSSIATFHGYWAEFPLAGTLCLIGILGVTGFPLASTFWGEDLIYGHLMESSWGFIAVLNFTFVLNGITLMRLFSYVFLGRRTEKTPGMSFDYSPAGAVLRLSVFAAGNLLPFFSTSIV
jgi:NADH:ubiquinone oxidoreductase subunit 5 (subunit L)/multisubunit Na+/H+ antiporter MnhA subunit